LPQWAVTTKRPTNLRRPGAPLSNARSCSGRPPVQVLAPPVCTEPQCWRRPRRLQARGLWAKLRLSKHSASAEFNKAQTPVRNCFHTYHLGTTEFHSVQQRLESGSGPGGRRFKSSLPDQSFQAHKQHFWFFVYSGVVDFVDGQSHRVQYAGDPGGASVLWKPARPSRFRVSPRASQPD
jgi:hypothetical protein